MAASKPTASAPTRSWPPAIAERLAVQHARALLQNATAEVGRCEAVLAAAETALEAHRAAEAERLLAALEAGNEIETSDGILVAAVSAARARLDAARSAQRMAGERHSVTVAAARATLAAEAKDILAEMLAEVTVLAREAIAANDEVRRFAQFLIDEGARLDEPYELALKLPNADQLAAQIEYRRNLLTPPPPPPPPKGSILVRWLVNSMPYMAGETAGVPLDDARLVVRAGLAELVDQSKAAKLGLDNLVKFTKPTKLRLTKNFSPRAGAMIPADTVQVFDPETASRLVNLSFAERA